MQIINPENPTLVLGGEEHEIEKLDETSKYYIDQVQDLNAQMNQFKAKLHQCEVARAGFVSLLKAELEALRKCIKDGDTDVEGTETKSAETDRNRASPEEEWENEGGGNFRSCSRLI